jgi:hypothetical protein
LAGLALLVTFVLLTPGCNNVLGCEAPFFEGATPEGVLVAGHGAAVATVVGELVFVNGFRDPSISISFTSPGGQTFDLTPSETVPQQNEQNTVSGFADVTIPSAALTQPGVAQIFLSRFCEGKNLNSRPLAINILPDPGVPSVPAISSISPTSETAGGPAFTLTVNGSNFISGSTINWNGSPLTTTFVSASQLTASVPAADITTPGATTITVVNPGGGTSNAIPFTIDPSSQIGIISVISESSDSVPANALPNPIIALSATGRFAAFENEGASNLDFRATQASDIYFHDSCVGVSAPCPITTLVASVQGGDIGTPFGDGNGPSIDETAFDSVSISGDGQTIAFVSHATDLSGTANFEQAYLSCAIYPKCSFGNGNNMASLTDNGVEPDGPSTHASISASGRYVAFTSFGTNLVQQPMPAAEAYLRDTSPNCMPGACTIAVSLDNSNPANPASAAVLGVAVSANGRYVVFSTPSTNLGSPEGRSEVFVRDTCINAPPTPVCTPSTTMVSVDNNNPIPNPALSGATTAGISDDGRFVAFISEDQLALNSLASPNANLYVRDTCQTESGPVIQTPPCAKTTTTVSVTDNTMPANAGLLTNLVNPHLLSGTGRFVVFASNATNLVSSPPTPAGGVFVRDTCNGVSSSGCTPTTHLVSVDSSGNVVQGRGAVISSDGHYCAFMIISGNSTLFAQEQAVLCRTGF